MKKGQDERVDTATQILDVAERLVQVRGFNGFSYADVAAELKITKAALHYHFAGKAELGEALVARYAARFAEALAKVAARTSAAPARLDAYADLYLDVLAPAAHVSVRNDGRGVRDPSDSYARRPHWILRRERAVARTCLGARSKGRDPHVHRFAKSDRPDDRQRPGRGDARGPALRRHHEIPRRRPSASRRSEVHVKSNSLSERLEGSGRRHSSVASHVCKFEFRPGGDAD